MKDLSKLKPRQVEAYLRETVRKLFGDAVENGASITASHGYYSITISRPNDYTIAFANIRKSRLPEIVKNLRVLAGR